MNFFIRSLKTYKWELSGLMLLLFVLFVNSFPGGYILLGGDVIQPIEMVDNFSFYYYEWYGRVSLYYGIFYFLDKWSISETAQLSWYLGIFLIGSYISFLSFCSIVFSQSAKLTRVLVSLFYATNIFTLYIFTAAWGYTSYQIIYIFIPLLTGLYIGFLESSKRVYALLFFLTSFFASSSFGNPAFALSLGIYFLFLTLLLFIFRLVKGDQLTFLKITLIAIGTFLLNAFWIIPLLPQVQAGVQEIATSTNLNLSETLKKTSNAIFDTLRLMPTSEQNRYFPRNFPYPDIVWLKEYITYLAFLPFLLILAGLSFVKEKRGRVFYGIFLAQIVIFIVLVARVRFPFETINAFLFQLPGFNTLRGYDKTATFTPFLFSVPLLILIMNLEKKRYFKYIVSVFFICIVLLALPFYAGGLQTKMSYILSGQKAKDFRVAKQSALVKIPQSYYDVASIFESDTASYKIAMLPYSSGSSVGRVALPEWKVNGPHVARYIYHKPFLELTEEYLSGWKFAEDFTRAEYNPEWIIDLYGLLGVKYIFYHKDAKPDSTEEMEPARQYLESIGAVEKIEENSSFILYQTESSRLFPYVYFVEHTDTSITFQPDGLKEDIQSFHAKMHPISYSRLNPKEVFVTASDTANFSRIFLNEKNDPLWVAEYVSLDGTKKRLERDTSVKFANAWYIENGFSEGTVKLYYAPMLLFRMSIWISGVTLLGLMAGLFFTLRKKVMN